MKFDKPKRLEDGAFSPDNPPEKQCIVCGIWYPGHIERHHGKSKGSGGHSTWADRYDVCVGPPNDCHGRAQRYEEGYKLEDLERARDKHKESLDLYRRLIPDL